MSINMRVYVGPYLFIDGEKFSREDVEKWEHIVCDGRGEAGVDDANWNLVPNAKIDGVEIGMSFDKYGSSDVAACVITQNAITSETEALERAATELLLYCHTNDIHAVVVWGVVVGAF